MNVTWYRDRRAWAIGGSLVAVAALDLLFPSVGLRTFLVVPVVGSIALGRPWWTASFSGLALVLFAAVSAQGPDDDVLLWRRLGVLLLTCAVSVIMALVVKRSRDLHVAEANRNRELMARAQEERAETQAILDSQIDPFVIFTPVVDATGRTVDLRFASANPAAYAYNESSPEAMLGRTFLEFFPGLLDNGPMAQYLRCAETGEPVILDDYFYPNEILGSERRYDIRAVKVAQGMALTWRDVTDRYRGVEQLAASERRYRLLAENASDVIWQVAPDGIVEWASDSTLPVLGCEPSTIVGTYAIDHLHPDDRVAALGARERVLAGGDISEEFRVRRGDGTYLWMVFSVRGFPTSEGVTRVVSLHDIDAEVKAREELAGLVGRDPLTGLMTRDVMEQRIAEVLDDGADSRVSLLCVGVDSLSTVNEAYTHAVGDIVLVTQAGRIIEEVGGADRVARGAGVDFIVLEPDGRGAGDSSALAERIRLRAKQDVVVGGRRIQPTVSIGIATGEAGDDPEQLIRAATLAMRNAKAAGRDQVVFAAPELAAEAERLLSLTSEIADGLRDGEFTCWYQPIHDLITGQVRGYEALARWMRSDGTLVEPAAFMPLLERSALIAQLDATVLQHCLADLSSLPPGRLLSINVSARSLSSDVYPTLLLDSVRTAGVDPARIHLEITETALLDVSDAVVERMQRIADVGIDWYVDDFGTGFSSISHLRDLPIAGLKLDISFTAGLGAGELRSIQLAQALAGLAQGLGLDTVAEGVETQEEAVLLSTQGWRQGQGWLFGKAQPAGAWPGH